MSFLCFTGACKELVVENRFISRSTMVDSFPLETGSVICRANKSSAVYWCGDWYILLLISLNCSLSLIPSGDTTAASLFTPSDDWLSATVICSRPPWKKISYLFFLSKATETDFLHWKEQVPCEFKRITHQWFNVEWKPIDWFHLITPLLIAGLFLQIYIFSN